MLRHASSRRRMAKGLQWIWNPVGYKSSTNFALLPGPCHLVCFVPTRYIMPIAQSMSDRCFNMILRSRQYCDLSSNTVSITLHVGRPSPGALEPYHAMPAGKVFKFNHCVHRYWNNIVSLAKTKRNESEPGEEMWGRSYTAGLGCTIFPILHSLHTCDRNGW